MKIKRLEIYRGGLSVERMHTVRHVIPYNNGHHSAGAALIAHELCVAAGINSASCVRYMLLHDLAEIYVGDTPANVKRDFPNIKKALTEAELLWEEQNIPDKPELHTSEMDICKAADLIELGMQCVDELNMGNKNVLRVLHNVIMYLMLLDHVKGVEEFSKHLMGVEDNGN